MFIPITLEEKPTLIEPGMYFFMKQTLNQCKKLKESYYNVIFNISTFMILLVIIGLILLYKYKGKLTPIEKEKKNREKEKYILSKIKNYQNTKMQKSTDMITNLPAYSNNDYSIR